MRGPRRLQGFLATFSIVVMGASMSGCVPASPDTDTYQDKVEQTLGAGVSELATVQQLLETLGEDRMFRATAITQMRYSQSNLDTASQAFTELNAPPNLDGLYDRTNRLMGEAEDVADDARTVIERGETAKYGDLAHDIQKLSGRMSRLEERTR